MHMIFSLKNLIFSENFLLKFYFVSIISVLLNTFMRKGKDPDLYLWLMDPDPGGQKTCGSGSQSLIFVVDSDPARDNYRSSLNAPQIVLCSSGRVSRLVGRWSGGPLSWPTCSWRGPPRRLNGWPSWTARTTWTMTTTEVLCWRWLR